MMRRTLAVASWMAGGGAAIAALYWAFLNIPESNVLTLSVSAALALIIVLAGAMTLNVAILLALGTAMRAAFGPAVRRVPWAVVALAPVAGAWWAMNRLDLWVARRSGEIGAWFIATLGWSDITPLFRAQSYLSTWICWVVAPVAVVAALTALLQQGPGSIRRPHWLGAAWHWRTLAVTTLVFVLFVALPWRAASWRPAGLPPTWVEPAAAGLRLLLVAAAIALGGALIVSTTARAVDRRR